MARATALIPILAAISLLTTVSSVLSGCRGTDEELNARSQTAPEKSVKRMPDLVGLSYAEAKAMFLRTGGRIVMTKSRPSRQPPGTVINQEPPPGERFTHSIELVVSRPDRR